MQSMTGFGAHEVDLTPAGKVCVELRSINHKFLEILVHLPEGTLSLEDRIKKTIETKIKRGRVTCAVNVIGAVQSAAFINEPLLKNYLGKLKNIKRKFKLDDNININTLVNLPGVLVAEEMRVSSGSIWPEVNQALKSALSELSKTRHKEGAALKGYLKNRTKVIKLDLGKAKLKFKKAVKEKLKTLDSSEEQSMFLKSSDINEEIERLSFHIHNLSNTLDKSGEIGKELDFIAQEMQREANTLAAKTFDVGVSAQVLKIKSSIEKVREQVQNIE